MVRLARETSDLRRLRRSLRCDPGWEDAQSADISAESPSLCSARKRDGRSKRPAWAGSRTAHRGMNMICGRGRPTR